MHSFTSNSKSRAPRQGALAFLLVAGLVYLTAMASTEWYWRSRGMAPSPNACLERWSIQREQLAAFPDKAIVLAGASRMTAGIDTDLLRELYPSRAVVQLAVDATAPMATLLDLANDEQFSGVIICSMSPSSFLRSSRLSQQEYVDYYYDGTTPSSRLDFYISDFLQHRFACLSFHLGWPSQLAKYASGQQPRPSYIKVLDDGSRYIDFSKADLGLLSQRVIARSSNTRLKPHEWIEQSLELDGLLHPLVNRGGTVVLVRFPIDGKLKELQKERFPRELYWDRFAEKSQCLTLHFKDVEGMRNLPCPDGSHLDATTRRKFTHLLVDVLVERGVLDPPATQ